MFPLISQHLNYLIIKMLEVYQFDLTLLIIIWLFVTLCFTGCPSEWAHYRGKCYLFSKDLHSFDDAKATCESSSASLLIINDVEEQVINHDSLFSTLRMKSAKIIMHWNQMLSLFCNM